MLNSGISFWMSLLLNGRKCVKLQGLGFWSFGKIIVGQFFKGSYMRHRYKVNIPPDLYAMCLLPLIY